MEFNLEDFKNRSQLIECKTHEEKSEALAVLANLGLPVWYGAREIDDNYMFLGFDADDEATAFTGADDEDIVSARNFLSDHKARMKDFSIKIELDILSLDDKLEHVKKSIEEVLRTTCIIKDIKIDGGQ